MHELLIKDKSIGGNTLHEIKLQFEKEYITVEELISARVESEVKKYQVAGVNYKNSLIVPDEIEKRLNGKAAPEIDVEKQIYVALDAFNKNGFFILIDNEQAESLDQKYLIDRESEISFVKLTPLVGG